MGDVDLELLLSTASTGESICLTSVTERALAAGAQASVDHVAAGSPREVTLSELLRIREERWSFRMRGYSLVAELEVKEQHRRQVAQGLGRFYAKWAGTARAEQVFTRWPACVAVAITGIAARDYRQGELWPHLWAGLAYRGDQKDQTTWGRGFLASLDDLGMPTFPELPMPYVGPILMHTGIPTYCLEDYFLLVSQRRATDPELDPESFLMWAIGRPHRLDTLDQPARRFLEYGTDYALDFVDRTFDLLDRLRDPAPDLDGVSLPPRVMARAQELAAEGGLNLRAPSIATAGRNRTERPRISLDPFGRGVEVILPAVGDAPDGFARWSVTADGATYTVRSQAQWAGVAEAAPATAFTLLQPARTVVVAMDGWAHQTELAVVDPNAPMLVFTEDGRRLAANMPLPPDVVWVAHPDEHGLAVDGPLHVTIEGQLPLGWNGWRLRQIMLDGVRSLELDGVPATRRPVRGHARPRIVTDSPVQGVATPYGTPVHAQVPEIWLPGETGAHIVWMVEIRSTGGGTATASETYTIDKSRTITELWDRLPRPLLGSFDIIVRGPLGRGATRTVFLAEGLGIRFMPAVRVFGPDGMENARAELAAAIGAQANPRLLTFNSHDCASVVEYRTDQETEPLVVTPPHLQVMHERADQPLAWSAGPLRIPADVFTEEPGALLVRVPGANTLAPLQMIVGGRVVQEVPPSGRAREGTARFDLTRVADTVAEHQRAELVLEVGGPVRLAIVRPRRLAARVERDGDHLRLIEFVPIEGLTAGVYATTAPWRLPQVEVVGQDGTIPLPRELRHAGPLLVIVQVDDPWAPAEWPRWPRGCLFVSGEGHLASDDPEETALSCFAAGEGEFPEHISDLRRVWALIHLARQLRTAPDAQRLVMTCAVPVQRRPAEAITALAGLGLKPDQTVIAVIASGLAATAAPDSAHSDEARKMWPVTPLLGVLCGSLADPDCFDAGERQCGDTLVEIASNGIDPDAEVGRFGPEVERMIHMDPQQIEGIWRAAQVVPRALLDPDTRAAAARRLFDHRGDGGIRQVSEGAATAVRTSLGLLADWPRLRAQIQAREHPRGLGGWFAVPAASAAFAILARLAAWGDEGCRAAEQSFRADWVRLAAKAPDLVIIDLVLAELLIGLDNAATQ
jgi:hypothetical protein